VSRPHLEKTSLQEEKPPKDDVTTTKPVAIDLSAEKPSVSPVVTKRERDPATEQVVPDAKRTRVPEQKAAPAPVLSDEECGLLVSTETLSEDTDMDDEVDPVKNTVEGFAKLPEDSLAMRHEAWKKLRDLDNVNHENGEKRAKAAKLALQKASAAYSDSCLVRRHAKKQRSPQAKTFPEFSSRYARSKPPPVRSPLPVRPTPTIRSTTNRSTTNKSPPVPPAGRVPVPPSTIPMALPGGTPRAALLPPPRPVAAYAVPRGRSPFIITKEQIRDAIPENASCIFHVMDRRVNLDAFAPDASFYSLLRAWTLDDPYRQIPPPGSNILDLVSMPSDRREPLKRSNVIQLKKRTREVKGSVNVLAKVKAQYQSSTPSMNSLRHELVLKSRLLKQEKRKEDMTWMQASRASLKSLGIDLPSTT
jgi:hypothetical protein